MRILVICQYYYPEPFRITDICEELVKDGHQVTVLTGIPNYPEGVIYKGYNKKEKRNEIINGVLVHRCFTIPRKKGAFYRLLNYYSYAISSSLKILFMRQRYDVVFVNQLSPVMMTYAGLLYKKIHHKKIVMYCLDLWPESLIAGGIRRESMIYKIFFHISKKIYQSCDLILVTSKSFIHQLSNNFGIDKKRFLYMPQYAENLFEQRSNSYKRKETIDLVFAGNIGELQSVQTIIQAADILKEYKNLRFHIVGGGTDLSHLKKMASSLKLNNIVFYGRKPLEEMPYYYNLADAMLVTLAADPILSLTLPGKVQSYMAAGKIIIGAINGETQETVKSAKCGFVSDAEDEKALAKNIQLFLRLMPEEKKELEQNSSQYYQSNFSKNKFMDMLEKVLVENC